MIYRRNSRKFLLPALLLTLAVISNLALAATRCATPPAAPGSPKPKKISIAEARSSPLGTVVTVDGSVTVPSGAFSSSTFDQGFAIQDHTGGIYVSVATIWDLRQGNRFVLPKSADALNTTIKSGICAKATGSCYRPTCR